MRFTELNKILCFVCALVEVITERFPGVGSYLLQKAMPLDLAFGSAMVVLFLKDWLPLEYYSYAGIGVYHKIVGR